MSGWSSRGTRYGDVGMDQCSSPPASRRRTSAARHADSRPVSGEVPGHCPVRAARRGVRGREGIRTPGPGLGAPASGVGARLSAMTGQASRRCDGRATQRPRPAPPVRRRAPVPASFARDGHPTKRHENHRLTHLVHHGRRAIRGDRFSNVTSHAQGMGSNEDRALQRERKRRRRQQRERSSAQQPPALGGATTGSSSRAVARRAAATTCGWCHGVITPRSRGPTLNTYGHLWPDAEDPRGRPPRG